MLLNIISNFISCQVCGLSCFLNLLSGLVRAQHQHLPHVIPFICSVGLSSTLTPLTGAAQRFLHVIRAILESSPYFPHLLSDPNGQRHHHVSSN